MEYYYEIKTDQLITSSVQLLIKFNEIERNIQLLFDNENAINYLMLNLVIRVNDYTQFKSFIDQRLHVSVQEEKIDILILNKWKE